MVAQLVQPAPVQPQPDATHRLNHKKLHVTQAALAVDEISNEQVLALARTLGVLIEWSIGDELHPTPADPNRATDRGTSTSTCTTTRRSTIEMLATARSST